MNPVTKITYKDQMFVGDNTFVKYVLMDKNRLVIRIISETEPVIFEAETNEEIEKLANIALDIYTKLRNSRDPQQHDEFEEEYYD